MKRYLPNNTVFLIWRKKTRWWQKWVFETLDGSYIVDFYPFPKGPLFIWRKSENGEWEMIRWNGWAYVYFPDEKCWKLTFIGGGI